MTMGVWGPAFECCWCRKGEVPLLRDEILSRKAPTAWVVGWECGLVSRGRWWGGPLAAPRTVGAAAPPVHPSPQGERTPLLRRSFLGERPAGAAPREAAAFKGLRANGRPGPTPVTLRQAPFPAPVTPRGHLCERPALPHTAPLDSCLRRNDSCGGVRGLREMETPLAAPLPWVPAFARTTMGVCGLASADGVGGGGPAVAGRAFRERPLRLGWWGKSPGGGTFPLRAVVGRGPSGRAPPRGRPPRSPFALRANVPARSLLANGVPRLSGP